MYYVYLLCLYKYTHKHVNILKNIYILNIFMYDINDININIEM